MGERKPLRIHRDHWRRRWLVLNSWNRLHRISTIVYEDDEHIAGSGVAVCGAQGRFTMPGILSRMGLPRCVHCCRALGIQPGDGAPFNALKGRQANV